MHLVPKPSFPSLTLVAFPRPPLNLQISLILPFLGLSANSSALTPVHAWIHPTLLLFPILISLAVTC